MSIRIFCFFLVLYTLCFEAKSAALFYGDSTNQNYVKAQSCLEATDYDCAEHQYLLILSKAKKAQQSKLQAQCYLDLGLLMYQVAKFDIAVKYLDSAIVLSKEFKFLAIMADAKQQLAHIDWRYGNNYEALSTITESIDLYKHLQDTSEMLKAKTILGGIYISLKKFEESAGIYNDLLESATRTKDTVAMTICNEHLGVIEFYKGNYDKARDLYTNALKLNRLLNRELEAALNLANIGEAYLESNKLNEANEYLQKSLQVLNEYEFNSGIIFVYHTIGRVNNKLGNYALADDYYQQSLALMEVTGEIRERNYVYQLISDNMADKGNHREALVYFKKYTAAKDSLFGIEKTKQLEELRAKYQLDKSTVENMELNLKHEKAQRAIETQKRLIRYQYIILAIILISFCLFIILYYSLRKSKQKLEVANTSKNRLFNIISHDIRNPVGNIAALVGLLEKTEDEKVKLKLLDMLKQSSSAITILVNSILSWSISNNEGFQFSKKNLRIDEITAQIIGLFIYEIDNKKIKLNNLVEANCQVYGDEDVVSTIIRNLLSNAIKYTPENGEVSIWIEVDNKYTSIHVKDSGVGMDEETIKNIKNGNQIISKQGTRNEKGTGLGFTLINDFIEKLHGKIEIKSKKNIGTEVIVFLPVVRTAI